MEKFKKFEIKEQSMILGGEIIMSIIYSRSTGKTRGDLYDTETGRTIEMC